jgi:hypothetical protein
MTIFRPIERPSWWYEPDDDEYTEAEMDLAYDCYVDDEGKEPDTDSHEWEVWFERWIEQRKEDAELAKHGL